LCVGDALTESSTGARAKAAASALLNRRVYGIWPEKVAYKISSVNDRGLSLLFISTTHFSGSPILICRIYATSAYQRYANLDHVSTYASFVPSLILR
jgi:hypothetical protein